MARHGMAWHIKGWHHLISGVGRGRAALGRGTLWAPLPITSQTEALGARSWFPAWAMLPPEVCRDHSMMVGATSTTSPMNLSLPTSRCAPGQGDVPVLSPQGSSCLLPGAWSLGALGQGVSAGRSPLSLRTWPWALAKSMLFSTGQARVHRITESQNGGGWKGPLWITQPNPPAEAGSPRAGCTAPCPGRV